MWMKQRMAPAVSDSRLSATSFSGGFREGRKGPLEFASGGLFYFGGQAVSDRRFGRFPADHGADVFFRACLAQGIANRALTENA